MAKHFTHFLLTTTQIFKFKNVYIALKYKGYWLCLPNTLSEVGSINVKWERERDSLELILIITMKIIFDGSL